MIAGLGLLEEALDLLPDALTGHRVFSRMRLCKATWSSSRLIDFHLLLLASRLLLRDNHPRVEESQ